MTGRYDHYTREALIGLLERRDVLQRYGLIWEREGIEPDRALNQDYVVFDLDRELSTPPQDAGGWRNLVIEGDNWDALRALRLTHAGRTEEQAAISELFAQESAFRVLRVSEHIDPQDLARRLLEKLRQSIERAGEDAPDQRALRRGLNVILVRSPRLCRDALRRAMGACAERVEAADLPTSWDSGVPLVESPLNLYRCIPAGLNTWEAAFADWLDRQDGAVIWWLRNLPQPRSANDWGVRIVLPDTGAGFYPDFVICVDGRKRPDGIALADTKERIDGYDGEVKSRTEHREYGRALILTYDRVSDRFIKVEFEPALGRNREGGILEPRDLLG